MNTTVTIPRPRADRYDDGERGKGRAAERAERVEDVARQGIDERGAASVATLVGGKWHRAEARERPGAGVRGVQAVREVLLRLALDVERQLFVELAFDPARRHQRAHPQEQIAKNHRSRQLHHAPDSRRHAFPLAGFDRQLPAPGCGEPVVLGPPAQLRYGPLCFNPALMLETM